MKTLDKNKKVEWLKSAAKSIQILANEEKPGLLRARLNRIKMQLEFAVEEMGNDEKED